MAPRIQKLIGDTVLLRRLQHRTEYVKTDTGTHEAIYEELPSGLAISDPDTVISRAEVIMVGPKCTRLKPGDTVVLAKEEDLSCPQWREDGRDYLLAHESDAKSPDLLFTYKVITDEAEAA